MNQGITSKAKTFYLIGAACNNLRLVGKALQQGVNGIECDVWADGKKKWWISHDGLFRTDLIKWLDNIEQAEQKTNKQLAVIVFDIKSAIPIDGLVETINRHLPNGLPHIYSTAKLKDAHIFTDIVDYLSPTEGISIDEEADPTEVATFFEKIGAKQCWYANGITLIPLNSMFHTSMQKAAPIRDTRGPFSKIYTWNVHRKQALYKYIVEDDVDGVIVGLNNLITKPVDNALQILNQRKNIVLANRNSSLFGFLKATAI